MTDRRIYLALPCILATVALAIYSFIYGQNPLLITAYLILLFGTVALSLTLSRNVTKQEVIESYSKVDFTKIKL